MKSEQSSGIGFLGLLAIVFITLKLCKVITWSWWWVTCPLWGGLALVIGFVMVTMLLCLICSVPFAFSKRRKNRDS